MIVRCFIGFAGLALGLALTPAAWSAGGRVVVLGASEGPLEVKFVRDTSMNWQGRLDLIIQNESDQKSRIRLRFFPEGASQAPVVAIGWRSAGEGVLVRRTFPKRSRAPGVPPDGRSLVSLAFSVSDGKPLRNASGTLVIELVSANPRKPAARAAAFASTFVRTKAMPAASVTFEPAAVKMAIVRRVWLRNTTRATFQVMLRGEGLNELAAGSSGHAASTRLHNDSGDSVQATIRDVQALSDDEAEATIELSGVAHSGSYRGTFPQLAGSQGARLNVTVDVQVWFWIAFALVGLGVATGWFVTHAAGIRRQKDVLRSWLIARIQEYEERAQGRLASFDLDDLLGPEPRYGPRVHCEPFPSNRTARDLLCRIAQARSEEDLKEDGVAAAAIIDAIESWLEIEPPAAALLELTESPPADRGPLAYIETPVGQDAEALLALAGDRPKDRAASGDLAGRLRHQAEVWRLGVYLWELVAELEERRPRLNNRQRKMLADNKLEKVAVRAKPDEPPTRADLKRIKQKLQRAIGRLQILRPPPDATQVTAEAEAEVELPALVRIFDKSDDLEAAVHGTVATVEKSRSGVRATVLFVVARTVIAIGAVPGRVVAFFEGVGRGTLAVLKSIARVIPRDRRDRDSPRGLLNKWTRRDVTLTIIAAAVSTVAYTITVYDSTWGTRDDYLSAFAAGFLGKVVVDWGDQYISKSLRISR